MLSRFKSLIRSSFILFSLTGAIAACDPDAADGPLAVSIEPIIYASASGEVFPEVDGAASAQLLIDGEGVVESEGSPFNLPFTTDELADGEHEITVVVRSEAGDEESATAKLIIDRVVPDLTVIDPADARAETGSVQFSVEDASPLRMIRLTVRDNAKGAESVFLCTEIPQVTYQNCEDLDVHLIVQDAATNRSVRTVEHEGAKGGQCKTSVSSACLPYRQ